PLPEVVIDRMVPRRASSSAGLARSPHRPRYFPQRDFRLQVVTRGRVPGCEAGCSSAHRPPSAPRGRRSPTATPMRGSVSARSVALRLLLTACTLPLGSLGAGPDTNRGNGTRNTPPGGDTLAPPKAMPDGQEPRQAPQQRGQGRLAGGGVYKAQIAPHWFADNTRCWYRNDLRGGAREFILVDAERGTREPAFDHAKLAGALSKAAGANYEGR